MGPGHRSGTPLHHGKVPGRSRAAGYWTTPVFTRAGSARTAQSGGTQERLATGGASRRRHSRRGAAPDATPAFARAGSAGGTAAWSATIWWGTSWSIWLTPVLVVDETGFLKKGDKSVGVHRQSCGRRGGGSRTVRLAHSWPYASAQGRTLLDREMYLPQVWTEDWERRWEAGATRDVVIRTKPQLAWGILERALESGVPFGWVAGDEVHGSDPNLRLRLEREGLSHALAIRRSEKLWAGTEKGPRQVRADRLASQVDELDWNRCSSGDGPRVLGFMTGPKWR